MNLCFFLFKVATFNFKLKHEKNKNPKYNKWSKKILVIYDYVDAFINVNSI